LEEFKERRRRLRFALDTDLRYEVAGRRGAEPIKGNGQVVDISSRGIAFLADGPLERNQRVKVSLDWPAKLDNQTPLRLVLEGVVLRTRKNLVVINIEHPEFRTAGKSSAAMSEGILAIAARVETRETTGRSLTVAAGSEPRPVSKGW
jgi:hypothetical protein